MLDPLRTESLDDLSDRLSAGYGSASALAIVERLTRQGALRRLESGGRSFVVTRGDHARHVDIAAACARRRASWRVAVDEARLEEALADVGLEPDDLQMRAIRMAIENPICVIHGGAGTGKSTVAVAISRYLRLTEPGEQVVAAFSARIASRTGRRCGLPHRTLHALTGTVPGEDWSEGEPLDPRLRAVFADEAFSIGPGILARLLRQAPDGCRIVLLGDPGQLPPIEGGRPLHDVVEVGAVPCLRLETSHRLAGSDYLSAQVDRVNAGHAPRRGPNLDVVSSPARGPLADDAKARLAADLHRRAVARGRSCVVLTPIRHGRAGHVAINAMIARRDAPGEGDEVITTGASGDGRWRNGEIGRVEAGADGALGIAFEDGRFVPDCVPHPLVAFGYAMSAHRAQGLEYDEVVLVFAASTSRDATRQMLASAMTRARRCTVITDPGVLARVAARDEVAARPGIIRAIHEEMAT